MDFINTDLILKAQFDLGPLVRALTARDLFLLGEISMANESWTATLESDHANTSLESTTENLLSAIESLTTVDQVAWRACTDRLFDFGYRASGDNFETSTQLKNPWVVRIAALGGTILFTVYKSVNAGH